MLHKILSDAAVQRGKYGPRDAARYVIGLTDAQQRLREFAPVVLHGNADHFIESAELSRGTRSYFSTSISENSWNKDTVLLAKYVLAIFRNHYFPGFPDEDLVNLEVLHPKEKSWDAHSLTASIHLQSGKILRPFRYKADYLRFAWLNSLLNHRFGLADPLDPKNCRPCVIKERAYGKQPPESLIELENEIRIQMSGRQIQNRNQIIGMLSGLGAESEAHPYDIRVRVGDTIWHLEGFAASSKFDSTSAFERYLECYSKPFRDVKNDEREVAERVRRKFKETVRENLKRFGIVPEIPADGLIIPSPEFFANEVSLPINYERENGKSAPSEIVEFIGHAPARDFERTENQVLGSIEPDPGVGKPHRGGNGKHLGETHRIGTKDHKSEDIFPLVTGSPLQRTASHPRVNQAVKRYADYAKNCLQEIERIAADILRLLAIPPLLRKLGVVRKPRWRNPKLRPSNEIARSLSSSPFLTQIRLSSAQQALIQHAHRPRNGMNSPTYNPHTDHE